MFDFYVTVNQQIGESQMADLKSVLEAGKNEILQIVRSEAAQHAAEIDELAAQIAAKNLSPEDLQAALSEIAGEVRGIVPDEAVEPPVGE